MQPVTRAQCPAICLKNCHEQSTVGELFKDMPLWGSWATDEMDPWKNLIDSTFNYHANPTHENYPYGFLYFRFSPEFSCRPKHLGACNFWLV